MAKHPPSADVSSLAGAESWGMHFPGSDTRSNAIQRVAIDPSAADELTDWMTLFADLLMASMSAHHHGDPAISGTKHIFLGRACWDSAIIAYGRCFTTAYKADRTQRPKLDDLLAHLTDEERSTHSVVMALRNKRVGHHQHAQSGYSLDFYFTVASVENGNAEISDLCVDMNGELYDTDLLERLGNLADRLRGLVGERIDGARESLAERLCEDPRPILAAIRAGASVNLPSGE